jgi:hypothetical protein
VVHKPVDEEAHARLIAELEGVAAHER